MKENNKNYILSIVLGAVALLLCIGALVLLYESTLLGTVYLKTSGNPEETVCWFYDCIESGDYASAYTCLAEYSDLGIEDTDESMDSKVIAEALRNSYKGTVLENLKVDGLTATANVEFTYLDLSLLQKAVEDGINPVLEAYIEKMDRSEIYDEGGDYSAEFLQKVYDEVLSEVISKGKDIYTTKEYQVELQYTQDGWKILTNKDMINCFLGGKVA